MSSLIQLLAVLFFSGAVWADKNVPEIPVAFSVQHIKIEGDQYLALNYSNHPEWHTYWKNPGDAGLPIKYELLSNGQNLSVEEMEWPAPKRYIEEGDILAYGYQGDYSLFLRLSQNTWKELQGKNIQINSTWLVCRHICIPGKGELSGVVGEGFSWLSKGSKVIDQDELVERFNNLPREVTFPPELDLEIIKSEQPDGDLLLTLNWQGGIAKDILPAMNLITPYPVPSFAFKREKLYSDSKSHVYGMHTIDWDGQYSEPPEILSADGKFASPHFLKFLYANPVSQKVEIIKKEFNSFSTDGYSRYKDFISNLKAISVSDAHSAEQEAQQTSSGEGQDNSSLFIYLILAFIGGLILNVMPCVLPVISLKLFELIAQREDNPRRIFTHNLAYSAGVLSTFLALALVVILLKSTGTSVGWGFQMQSPTFMAIMIVVVFIFSLNLFGLFEFSTPGGKVLGNVQLKKGIIGDFSGGVLATILSTPCSAPFLGTALTFAFGSTSLTIFLIFMMIGFGLAFPFLLTAIIPQLVTVFPKPGKWMEDIKKFLGLSLILTTVWLVDVFSSLVSTSTFMMKLNTLLALIFFGLYFWQFIGKKKWSKILFLAIPIAFFAQLLMALSSPQAMTTSGTDLLNDKIASQGLEWETWSEEAMKKHQQKGDLVFMDFTAKWCFTCKVNEKLVIDTDSFRNLMASKNVKLLLADWTRRDPLIESFLQKNGYVGVPAYFIQKADGTLVSLGETISLSEIEKNLN
ncbi:MAG: hypothetical protein COW00_11175 [Bdellovibrio sp. CG12_big_fil_rev_8_21_14_0_65_39_13]|nr:MAG: hypothetical protein COW78_16530 [Bdellovibrio sp. CG22_combo_CG10-13_8_21_14_all_39_27]PIQ59282.1 MAG: hypothetical protein COW00_11175 [Bdellovibrio sp. CG12_big_fil_rev_8_21_14_0_65_39_13]PIR32293.1 MAG: hypothetical protein COV37_20465 [Bdellovibrio sp. CG11_big_fil_rev_8_21_14_0_20_39_38]